MRLLLFGNFINLILVLDSQVYFMKICLLYNFHFFCVNIEIVLKNEVHAMLGALDTAPILTGPK